MTNAEQLILHAVVLMSEEDYQTALVELQRREKEAYSAYCQGARVTVPPLAGHGSFSSELNNGGLQDKWYAAKRQLHSFRSMRENWELAAVDGESVRYSYLGGGHDLTLTKHGIDLSDCKTPSAAVAKVRAAAG